MESKIKVLLEDDNEILGNGTGHPVFRQYLPTKKYVQILNKFIEIDNKDGLIFYDMHPYLKNKL